MARIPLSERSLAELEAAKDHLADIVKSVGEDAAKWPGPGWEPVIDLLKRDQEELHAELVRRQSDS